MPIQAIRAVLTPLVARAVMHRPTRPAKEISPGARSRMGVRVVARPSEPREKSLSRVKVEARGPE